MTLITFEDGKPLMKDDGKIGTEQACCCEQVGACCVPPKEPCRVMFGPCAPGSFGTDGCPEELGQFCDENVFGERNCVSDGDVPIGTCEGDVIGPPVPGYCVENSTRAECDAVGGTLYTGQTCVDNESCPVGKGGPAAD